MNILYHLQIRQQAKKQNKNNEKKKKTKPEIEIYFKFLWTGLDNN